MAALQPPVGGLPSQSGRSFVDVLTSSTSNPIQSTSIATAPDSHANPKPILGLHKGLPSIEFTDPDVDDLSKPYGWSLIGKFAYGYNKQDPKLGRPSVDTIQKFLVAMDFKGAFTVGLMDNRHVWIHFTCEIDYLRLYSRPVWFIGGIAMRMFKWTPFFQVAIESSLVPVWVQFPRLPIQFFQQSALFPIASLLGLPLRSDHATLLLKRPSVARIQVELDLLKPRPEKIWIKIGSKGGYWQKVEYENVPSYCTHCWHVGHSESACHVHNPTLKPQDGVLPMKDKSENYQWLPKQRPGKEHVELAATADLELHPVVPDSTAQIDLTLAGPSNSSGIGPVVPNPPNDITLQKLPHSAQPDTSSNVQPLAPSGSGLSAHLKSTIPIDLPATQEPVNVSSASVTAKLPTFALDMPRAISALGTAPVDAAVAIPQLVLAPSSVAVPSSSAAVSNLPSAAVAAVVPLSSCVSEQASTATFSPGQLDPLPAVGSPGSMLPVHTAVSAVQYAQSKADAAASVAIPDSAVLPLAPLPTPLLAGSVAVISPAHTLTPLSCRSPLQPSYM